MNNLFEFLQKFLIKKVTKKKKKTQLNFCGSERRSWTECL